MRARLCHLYPNELNIYADRGNIAVFAKRLAWRGHELEVTEVGPGEAVPAGGFDIYYMGGGQDRDQDAVARDLTGKAADLRAAAKDGKVFLFVCGGYQLAGHHYVAADGSRLEGLGILDLTTSAGIGRLIGDLVIETTLGGERRRIVGYENHVGRTELGDGSDSLGWVVSGHGNNDIDGTEGAVTGRAVGTYLHGPLLPKNPGLADVLLAWALDVDALEPLDDTLEAAAHAAAVGRAGVKR